MTLLQVAVGEPPGAWESTYTPPSGCATILRQAYAITVTDSCIHQRTRYPSTPANGLAVADGQCHSSHRNLVRDDDRCTQRGRRILSCTQLRLYSPLPQLLKHFPQSKQKALLPSVFPHGITYARIASGVVKLLLSLSVHMQAICRHNPISLRPPDAALSIKASCRAGI